MAWLAVQACQEVGAVVGLIHEMDTWECTATDLLTTLDGTCDEVAVDATRLSKALNKLASQLAGRGITAERLPRGGKRGLRLHRRQFPNQ